MKKISPLFLALVILGCFFGAIPQSHAAAPQRFEERRLQVSAYDDNVNMRCPKGYDKIYLVEVRVRRTSPGSFMDGNRGYGQLVLRSGRVLKSKDYVVPPEARIVDFYFFAGRRSQVKKDPASNWVRVELADRQPGEKPASLRISKVYAGCGETQ